jgi:hypothetical protein
MAEMVFLELWIGLLSPKGDCMWSTHIRHPLDALFSAGHLFYVYVDAGGDAAGFVGLAKQRVIQKNSYNVIPPPRAEWSGCDCKEFPDCP